MAKVPMPLEDLPGNSKNSSRQKPQGKIVPKRKPSPLLNDIRAITISLFEDTLIPAVRGLLYDFGITAWELMIYGESKSAKRGPHTSYNRMYKKPQIRRPTTRTGARHVSLHEQLDLGEVYFDTRAEAEAVLSDAVQHIAKYSWLTVGDLLSFSGLPTRKQIYDQWGWAALNTAKITRIKHGWLLDLPEPEYAE